MERRWGIYYIKGVTVRFGFDVLELRKFKQIVKNKATGTPYGMFIYITLLADILRPIKVIIIYSSAWGFRRCSFRQSGQCEGLYTVERATRLAPRFFMPIRLIRKFDEMIDLKATLSQFLSDRCKKCCKKSCA